MLFLFSALTLSLSLISVATAWNDPEQEASTFLRNKLERERTIIFCEDSSFTATKRGGVHLSLIEMKGGRFSVKSLTLSEADKLNGVQWQGAVWYYVDALRDRTITVVKRKSNGWSEWGEWFSPVGQGGAEAFVAARVRLKHGQWEYMSGRVGLKAIVPYLFVSTVSYGELFRDFRGITCEDIRKTKVGESTIGESGK